MTPEQENAELRERLARLEALIAPGPQKGRTPGCECNAEGYTNRDLHQFGCPYGGQKPVKAWQGISS